MEDPKSSIADVERRLIEVTHTMLEMARVGRLKDDVAFSHYVMTMLRLSDESDALLMARRGLPRLPAGG